MKTRNITLRPFTPWYNSEINEAKKLRRKYEKLWRNSKLTVHKEMYLDQKKITSELIKKSKRTYYTDKVLECGKDQKALFKLIDNLQGKSPTAILPSVDCPLDAAEEFSEFFFQKICDIRDKLDSRIEQNENATAQSKSVLPLPVHAPVNTMENFTPMTNDEIGKLIAKSPPKSCSLDPVPTWFLKANIEVLLPTISTIVNKSLQLGYFPLAMRKALVSPLLKKPSLDSEVKKNYRPVSNLSFVSKIIEKAAMSQVYDFSVINNLLTKFQSAYRPLHSTETALLCVMNDLLCSLDAGKGVILCLLDLSAAFDTIDHHIFFNRLHNRMGIQGTVLDWFKSYLSDRYQSIHVNGAISSPKHLTFGLPQGSHIGPQAFSYYTDEVPEIAEGHGVSAHLYADDTQLFLPFSLTSRDPRRAAHQIEDCIEDVRKWMQKNKLKLNEEKTELLILLPARQIHKCSLSSINIGGCQIEASSTVRNLGVLFDSTLQMKPQVNAIVKSCNFQLRRIGKLRQYLSSEAATNLIHAFITSRLDYGNSLLVGLPDKEIAKLQKVQNTAARILSRIKKHEHISPILMELHWLKIKERIDFKILVLTYKCLNSLAPQYLSELIHVHKSNRNLRSVSQYNLKVPKTRLKTYGDRAFSHIAPVLWNKLPEGIKRSQTLESFKSQLKTHLFSSRY